jgi:hypothetical protein
LAVAAPTGKLQRLCTRRIYEYIYITRLNDEVKRKAIEEAYIELNVPGLSIMAGGCRSHGLDYKPCMIEA